MSLFDEDFDTFLQENLLSLDCSKLAAQIENFISANDTLTSENDSSDNLDIIESTFTPDLPDLDNLFQDVSEANKQKYQDLAKKFTTQDPKCRQMFKQNAKYRNSVVALQAACIQNPNMSRVQLCKTSSANNLEVPGQPLEERIKNTVAVRRSYVKMKIYAAIAEADATEANVENLKLKIRVATLSAYVNILLGMMSSKMTAWDLIKQKRKAQNNVCYK